MENKTNMIRLVYEGRINDIKQIFEHGIDFDINEKDENGFTPLFVAVSMGYVDIVKSLLEYGSDPNILYEKGTPLLFFAINNDNREIAKLLCDNHANINYKEEMFGYTPLFLATIRNNINMVDFLLNYGANPDIQNNKGLTPLIYASGEGYVSIVELLIKYSANINIQQRDGMNALQIAALKHSDIFTSLSSFTNPFAHQDKGVIDGLNAKGECYMKIMDLLLQYENQQKTSRISTSTDCSNKSQSNYGRGYRGLNIVFLDTETTDLDNPILIQLAYKYNGTYHDALYGTGGKKISLESMTVHHITEDMIKDKKPFNQSEDKIILQGILKDNILVAHNAKFDVNVLESHGVYVDKFIDTLRVSRYLWPKLDKHNEQYLRYYFDIKFEEEITPHDALSDIKVLEKVFEKMIEEFKNQSEYHNIEDILNKMIEVSKKPSLLYKCNFGKYKGMLWKDVPKDYLHRILDKSESKDEDIIYTANYYT